MSPMFKSKEPETRGVETPKKHSERIVRKRVNFKKLARSTLGMAGAIILTTNIIGTNRTAEPVKKQAQHMELVKIVRPNVSTEIKPQISVPVQEKPTKQEVNDVTLASTMYTNILTDLKYEDLQPSNMLNHSYLLNLISEARKVSNTLNIPFAFVMSDWLMESGKLSTLSNKNIEFNNLANLGYEGNNGTFVLMKFNTLNAFADAYTKVLRSEGVENTSNLQEIVTKMGNSGFFIGESAYSYLESINGAMQLVSFKEYNPYNTGN